MLDIVMLGFNSMLSPVSSCVSEVGEERIIYCVVLGTLLLDYVLTLTSSLLNYNALGAAMPLEFSGVYDATAYASSQAYTRAKTRFSLVHTTFDLAVMLAFWHLDGFDLLDGVARSTADGEIARGVVYLGVMVLVSTLIDLPWSVYSTFVIEERFGFNKTTARTFVLDRIKGLLLTAAIGLPIAAAMFAFFLHAGPRAWLYCWGFLATTQIFLVFVAPVWIMPLFNEFKPLENQAITSAIQAYAEGVGFRYGGIYEIDGSRRSSHSNAFFTGFGATKRIALFDTLVEKTSVTELLAILAHEVGHEKLGHIRWSIVFQLAYTFALLYIMSLFLSYPPLFAAFGVASPSVYVGLILFQLLFSPVDTLLQVVLTMRSRANEFAADRYSVETYRQPEALVSGLKHLSKDNLDNLTPHPLHVFLSYSHPPVLARIAAIRAHGAARGLQPPN